MLDDLGRDVLDRALQGLGSADLARCACVSRGVRDVARVRAVAAWARTVADAGALWRGVYMAMDAVSRETYKARHEGRAHADFWRAMKAVLGNEHWDPRTCRLGPYVEYLDEESRATYELDGEPVQVALWYKDWTATCTCEVRACGTAWVIDEPCIVTVARAADTASTAAEDLEVEMRAVEDMRDEDPGFAAMKESLALAEYARALGEPPTARRQRLADALETARVEAWQRAKWCGACGRSATALDAWGVPCREANVMVCSEACARACAGSPHGMPTPRRPEKKSQPAGCS